MDRRIRDFEMDGSSGVESGRCEVFDDFVLGIDRDSFPASEFVEIDPVGAAGLAAAARRALVSAPRWAALSPLRDELEAGLLALAKRARVNGRGAERAPHVTNIAFAGWSGPELVAALDLEGIAVSSGSACSAGTSEPSPVLLAMGAPAAARASVRFSLGEETTAEDIALTLAAAARVLGRGG